MPESQGTSCTKQVPYLKSKWLQWNSNPQLLSSQTNTQPFSRTGQMIALCCEYLSVRCIWLYVLIISSTRFRVNLHSIAMWISRNSLLETGAISVRNMVITYSQMLRTDKYSQNSSIIWPFWLNSWVFVYELSWCGFESRCSQLILLIEIFQ